MLGLLENPTIEEILQQKEGQFFDRKSARIEPRDLANHIVAFANADGGFIVVGIEDDHKITGLNDYPTKLNAFLKDIRLELPLPKLLNEAFRIIGTQLREFTRLVKGGKFATTPEYPEFAWQEAIANAVIHRAYSITGTDIHIKIFDDRLEIESPGKLPGLVRIHNMRRIHFSRNPLIARVMTDMEYMQDLGEGVDRMILEMEKLGLEPPVFEEYAFMMRTALRNNLEKRGLKLPAHAEVTDDLAELNQRQLALLAYLRENESVSRVEYEQMFGVSDKTAKSDFRKLSDKGLIKKLGDARLTRYKLV